MLALLKRLTPFLLVVFTLTLVDATVFTPAADARSQSGGRSFSSPMRQSAPQQTAPGQFGQQRQQQQMQQPGGGFGRGLMGGLVGGALGGLLFGSMFGMGGNGIGIVPLLLLGGVGYFLYKRFVNRPPAPSSAGYQSPGSSRFQAEQSPFGGGSVPPVPPIREVHTAEQGLAEIRQTDPGFDDKYFLEVASDVFFKVQAGWMRRDLDSYRHLLGTQLAAEYEGHFARMRESGRINKLESIAIRRLEIVDAGCNNGEDYVTVLFTANLLDYTVDDKTGALIEGSMTEPVKFAEQWTWARPVLTEDWKLEGIQVVEG
ncbi:Tim44 domain-containing protein [Desulfobulbus sp.]|uniref:Tim44 domain-containing protein n=1 Tax=Desulfobulbus sp. TaxID=895 RepID=UPI00286F2BBC|nr:Tim44 domain-containing protein [Desulfobulbus sp.]